MTFDIGHAYVCEVVRSRLYTVEDFVTPHADRVFNAHIYHEEVEALGHKKPERLEDIKDRLALLLRIGCAWWVIEMRDAKGLLETKKIIEEYLEEATL